MKSFHQCLTLNIVSPYVRHLFTKYFLFCDSRVDAYLNANFLTCWLLHDPPEFSWWYVCKLTRPSLRSFSNFFSVRIIGCGMLWFITYEIIVHQKHIFPNFFLFSCLLFPFSFGVSTVIFFGGGLQFFYFYIHSVVPCIRVGCLGLFVAKWIVGNKYYLWHSYFIYETKSLVLKFIKI